ncbi:mechanosensitive ion channel family protein [Patescibacteria group bacterium]|nr:mechanosensitive ion channel family protein [Patescibacteria group bacterium]MBU1672922.1 mechanosensitive ion channel family protein [Patescibacteria group bacterium]MBU1963393.1 mechanosensitive ion channel family protein [Patescibacteria group bacterium]
MIDQLFSSPIWDETFWGNTLYNIFLALMAFILLFLVFWLAQRFLLRHFDRLAKKTKSKIDDVALQVIRTLKPPFYFFLAFYLALSYLVLNPVIQKVIDYMLLIWVAYQAVMAMQIVIDFIFMKKIIKEQKDENTRTALKNINTLIRFAIWIIGIMLVLANMGVNITSLIAGLGVAGIAVAFALQNILSDLFSSFSIYFDKPFIVGDYISAKDISGTVVKIGIKSTRLKSDTGEEIVVANNDLTSKAVHNFGHIDERRTKVNLTMSPETKHDKLAAIPQIITEVIKEVPNIRLDRVHFTGLNDLGYLYDLVYFTESPEFKVHLDAQQDIYLKLKQSFDKAGINFSFPKYLQQ